MYKDLSAGAFNKRVQINVAVFEVRFHVVVVVTVPRGEDDSVVLGRTEVYHYVVDVGDLRRLDVDVEVLAAMERHDRCN